MKMTILTISKEEILRRKTNSDIKNDTEELTFENVKKGSSHGAAAKRVREIKDELAIKRLMAGNDITDLINYEL
jgi:hypothetical protein